MTSPLRQHRVLVAGGGGMVGGAICRELEAGGIAHRGITRRDVDLRDRSQVETLFKSERFDSLVVAAAKVGGIHANNTYPADFIYDNLMIEANLIDAAYRSGCERMVFLGSSCIYPRNAPQPIREDALLGGPLEPTNEPYAIAKIAGIKLCESYNRQHGTDYRSLMPTNLYGPGDNFHPENAHVIPALMRRFHAAKQQGAGSVEVWGTGRPRREFLHVQDLARAVVHVLGLERDRYWKQVSAQCSHLNVGTGTDLTIAALAELLRDVVGLDAEIEFDTGQPDGTPRKLLDVSRLEALGWRAEIRLADGLARTYRWYLSEVA